MYYSDEEAKQLICEYGKRVYRQGMVAGNEGNISVRTGADAVWVTPTGVSKNDLTPGDAVQDRPRREPHHRRSLPVSSESKMHYGIYRESGKAGAVFHTHATFATAFACAETRQHQDAPELLGLFGEEIQVAPYGRPGTFELPEAVRPYVKTNRRCSSRTTAR